VKKLLLGLTLLAAMPAEAEYRGPFVNAHLHINGNSDVAAMVRQMDATDTRYGILIPRYYGGSGPHGGDVRADAREVEAIVAGSTRFFTLFGMQRDDLCFERAFNDRAFVRTLIADIRAALEKKSTYVGVGEMKIKHFSYGGGPCSEVDFPVDSRLVREVLRTVQEFDRPLLIHMEGAPGSRENLRRLLREFPKARLIWAHNCGRTHPKLIRDMLAEHPNLHCDIANMGADTNGYGRPWPRVESYTVLMVDRDNVLNDDQRRLMNDFADRFLAGTDEAHTRGQQAGTMTRRLGGMRKILGQLEPEAAEKIAYRNAIRVFGLPVGP
jgi:hypothetical protein